MKMIMKKSVIKAIVGVLLFNLVFSQIVFAGSVPPLPPQAPAVPENIIDPPVAPLPPNTPNIVHPVLGGGQNQNSNQAGGSGNSPMDPGITEGNQTEIPTTIQMPDGQIITVRPDQNGLESSGSNTLNSITGNNINKDEVGGSKTTIKNDNDANTQNQIVANSNSGNNKSSYNTGDGNVITGDSNLILSLLNLANTNFVALPGGGILFFFKNILTNLIGNFLIDPTSGETYNMEGARVDAENKDTGAGSNNNTSVSADNSLNIINDNDGKVNNNLNLISNTGNNDASKNTGDGSVTTGDSNVSLNLFNFLNSNFIVSGQGILGILNIFGNWMGNLLLPKTLVTSDNTNEGTGNITVKNENTGANSVNNANANLGSSTEIENNNDANTDNKIIVSSNTGNNDASKNTGDGSVSTGISNIQVTLKNLMNQNIFGDTIIYIMVNVLGKWTGMNLISLGGTYSTDPSKSGDITVENTNTGADSINNAGVSLTDSTKIENNNDANLTNNININSNTGNNDASKNTGNGSVTTGDSGVIANILNFMNFNVVAKNFVFFVVNVFGDWTGNIQIDNGSGEAVVTTTGGTNQGSQNQVTTFIHTTGKVINQTITGVFTGETFEVTVDNKPAVDAKTVVLGSSTPAVTENNNPTTKSGLWGYILSNLRNIFIALFLVYISVIVVYYNRKRKNNRIGG